METHNLEKSADRSTLPPSGNQMVVGAKQLRKALLKGRASRVFLAKNADPAITEPIEVMCQQYHIECAWVPNMLDLGKACGIEVGAALELVASRAVEVVHQDVLLLVVELEYTTTLHGRMRVGIGIQVLEVLYPRTHQALRCGLLYAVLVLAAALILRVALIEEVIHPILVDDVVVDRAILGGKELTGFALKSREVLIGIGIVGDERAAVAALQGEVDHILLCLAIVNALRCPHPVGIGKVFGEIL